MSGSLGRRVERLEEALSLTDDRVWIASLTDAELRDELVRLLRDDFGDPHAGANRQKVARAQLADIETADDSGSAAWPSNPAICPTSYLQHDVPVSVFTTEEIEAAYARASAEVDRISAEREARS